MGEGGHRQRKRGEGALGASEMRLATVVAVLVIVRQLVSAGLPIYVRESYFDDQLMLRMAEGLVAGDWLGPYDSGTLMKGCFFPMLLAGIHLLGLPYLGTLTALHSLACVFFVSQMRFLLNDRRLLLVLLAVLLFDPGSFAARSFQSLYRNAITIPQVLVLFGAVFGLWLDFGARRWKDVGRSLVAGVALWAFWNTREDAMWVAPFMVVGLSLVFAKGVSQYRGSRAPQALVAGVLCCVLPVAVAMGGNALVKAVNEAHYGAAVRLECADGAFAKALASLYEVEDDADLQYVSVSAAKLERLYAASPTLASIRPELDGRLAFYSTIGRYADRGETEDGWFLWALRRAAFDAGKAASLEDAQTFYTQVEGEVEAAVASGELEARPTMPSALMSPWRQGYGAQMLHAVPRAIRAVLAFDGAGAYASQDREVGRSAIERYSAMAGNAAVAIDDAESAALHAAMSAAARVNAVAKIYQALGVPLGIAAAVAFACLLVACIRTRARRHLPVVLVVLGMALSLTVMCIGIAYTEITAFPAIRSTYLAGAYPLALSCTWLTLLYCWESTALWGKRPSN